MSAWSCPHDLNGVCQKVAGAACDPGMRGCVLHGKVRFASEEQNLPRKPVPSKVEGPVKKGTVTAPASTPKRRLPF
jgi:hypothetical protein